MGTTSVVLNADGTLHSEARHYPYGEERWSGGTLPTDYRFTGQRELASINLVHMGARFYDAALGRWISADTIVPDPSNPQSFNRFLYALGNPIRFCDPTGHYSKDEIKTAFEAATWDQVLDMFRPNGVLEGLWGWLEILRQASDGDMAMLGAIGLTGNEQVSLGALPGNLGFFSRDDAGHIFVGKEAQTQFAAKGRGYTYSLLKKGAEGFHTLDRVIPSTVIHFHPYFEASSPDWSGALGDGLQIAVEYFSAAAFANLELFPEGQILGASGLALSFHVQLGQTETAVVQILTYGKSGRFDSDQLQDVVSLVPVFGTGGDWASLISNLFWDVRMVISP